MWDDLRLILVIIFGPENCRIAKPFCMEPVKYPWYGFYKYLFEKKEANTSPHYENRNLATELLTTGHVTGAKNVLLISLKL